MRRAASKISRNRPSCSTSIQANRAGQNVVACKAVRRFFQIRSQRLKLEVKTSYVHIEYVVIVLRRCRLNWLERPDSRIQESSVEMIRECFDFVTECLGGCQVTGIRAKDGCVAENSFSGSKSFGIASGDDD